MSTNNLNLKGKFKRMCPRCTTAVHVRTHVCPCGHSFLKEKLEVDKKNEAKQLVLGKKAVKNNSLSRSFATLQKHSNRLRGAGYRVAVIYYKENSHRPNRSVLPGSCLSVEQSIALAKVFYCMSSSSQERKNSSLEDETDMDLEWKSATSLKFQKTGRVRQSVGADMCDNSDSCIDDSLRRNKETVKVECLAGIDDGNSDSCIDDSLIEVKKEIMKVECWPDYNDGYYDMYVGDDRNDSKDSLHIKEGSTDLMQ